MSLISSSTVSAAAASAPSTAACEPAIGWVAPLKVFVVCAASTRLLFVAGSSDVLFAILSYTKEAMLLKRSMRAGESESEQDAFQVSQQVQTRPLVANRQL